MKQPYRDKLHLAPDGAHAICDVRMSKHRIALPNAFLTTRTEDRCPYCNQFADSMVGLGNYQRRKNHV